MITLPNNAVVVVVVAIGAMMMMGASFAFAVEEIPWVYDTTLFGNPYHWGQLRDSRNAVLYPECGFLTLASPRRIQGHPIGTMVPPLRVAVQSGEKLNTGESEQQAIGLELKSLDLNLAVTSAFTIALTDGGGPANSSDGTRLRPQLSVSMTDLRAGAAHPLTGEEMTFTDILFVTPSENELASSVALEMQFIFQSAQQTTKKLSVSVFAVESMTGGLSGLTTLLDNIPTPLSPDPSASPGTTISSIQISDKEISPMSLFPSGWDYVYFEAPVATPPCTEQRDIVLLVDRVSIATHQLKRLRERLFGANSTRIAYDLLNQEEDFQTVSGLSLPDCLSQSYNESCIERQSLLRGNTARNSALVPPVITHMSDVSTVVEGSTSLFIFSRTQLHSLEPWVEEDTMWREGALVIASLALAGLSFLLSVCMLGVAICRDRV